MVRIPRVKHERDNMHYHVMTRCVQQAFLLDDPVIKEWIYRKIVWLSSIYFVDLHAVAVMSNHYHIVLSVRKPPVDHKELQRRFEARQSGRRYPQKWYEWLTDSWYAKLTDLSEFMKELNESVARYVNFRNQKRGHVWGDRFKSVLIEEGRGLLTCMAYVELNCVRAGLCAKPSEYRWCSLGRFHQGGSQAAGVKIPNLLGFEHMKQMWQRQKGFALFADHIAQYGVEDGFSADHEEIEALINRIDLSELAGVALRRTRWMVNSLILGSESFCSEMIVRFSLQSGRYAGPRPFDLGGCLFNGHQRASPP